MSRVAPSRDSTIRLTDGRVLAYAEWGDPDGRPVFFFDGMPGTRLVMFDPGAAWRAYGFVQDTVAAKGSREDNGRIGAGGSYRLTKRFRIDGEASDGDLGSSGKVGTNFLYSDRTNLYLNYALENERTDNGMRSRRGNLT